MRDSSNLGAQDINGSIARWALPGENIPLHLKIEKEITFDRIIVHLPNDFQVVDLINIDKYSINDNDLTIYSVKKAKNAPSIFFGLAIKYIKIPKDLKFLSNINIEIVTTDKTLSYNLECRIFRPFLKVNRAPEVIELVDGSKENKIELDLQYVGFGDITVEIQAQIGGNIVSQGDSLIHEVLLRLYEDGILNKFEEPNQHKSGNGLEIMPDFVNQVIQKIQEILDDGNLPIDLLCKEDIEKLKGYIIDIKKKENFSQIIFEEINSILLSILSDILEKNPGENIELANRQTRIKTKINAPIEKINITIKYTDLMKNDYDPLILNIKVDDKLTTHRDTLIEMPIKIEKIDNKPFLNVKDIDMEG